jgi:uncharacterized protein (TIGR03435 family)
MRLLPDRGRIQFRWQTIANLAHFISTQVDRPVLDATGLKGRYALMLSWYREAMRPAAPAVSSNVPSAPDPLPRPTIFEAVHDQLGLKLQPKSGWIEMVVIDRIEKTPIRN